MLEDLSARLTARYVHYLETFMVDLCSDDCVIEFRAGFTLRADHVLRNMTYKVQASAATTDAERSAIIAAVFEEIEAAIDDAVADNPVASN